MKRVGLIGCRAIGRPVALLAGADGSHYHQLSAAMEELIGADARRHDERWLSFLGFVGRHHVSTLAS
jgi:hypothetical protein